MQIITDVRQRAQQLLQENSTTLLTAGGVVGTVTTAVLAWRGGTRYQEFVGDQAEARRLISERENQEFEHFTRAELAQMALPHMVGPVITGTATVAAIIFSHKMNAQKAAALAAAYGLSQKQLEEYKDKVAEKLGVQKTQKLDDELAQERVNNTPGSSQIVVVEGNVLCFDQPTGRYFRSTMEKINQAVNALNAEILHHDHASATYFYEELGLPATTWTDEVGWNTDRLLELSFSTVMSEDNQPCLAIDFKTLPKLDYVPSHY